MIVSAPNSFLHWSISVHICFAFSMSNFLALKNLYHHILMSWLVFHILQVQPLTFNSKETDLSIIWWSSCLEGSSSSKISAWRNASTACKSSASMSSSIATDITLLFLRPFLFKECLNLVEALIAFFLRDPSLVFLSSSENSMSDFSRPV